MTPEELQVLGKPHNRFHKCTCGEIHCCYTDQMIHISEADMSKLALMRYGLGMVLGVVLTYLVMA